MKIIVVDDEELVIDNMLSLLGQVEPEAETTGFTEPEEAFSYLAANSVDIAFLDIELGRISGVVLAKKCKELCPRVNIIFVTGYSEYAMEAFRLHASGYLIKPVRLPDLRVEIENLRYPLQPGTGKRVRIQTFGNFEIFVDGRPIDFPRSKCRESLAYLVDRKGARVTTRELAAILWGDRPYNRKTQNNIHQIIFSLMQTLKETGIQDIVIKNRKDISLDPEKVECDYYRAIGGDMAWMNTFAGEYMTNYSWAEFTLGELIWKKL